MNLGRFPTALLERSQVTIFDDFTWYVTAHGWATVASDSGTVSAGDAANGILAIVPSDGTVADNDESYVKYANEVFKVAAGRTIYAEALVQFTEANTNTANVAFGLQNAVGANSIVDDGAGLKVSGDTFAIYKVDGSTVWKCVSCVNGNSTVSTSLTTAGGTAYQRLSIEIRSVDATSIEITFFVDQLPLLDSLTHRPIKHTALIASATEMQLFAGQKNGAITAVETLYVDYIAAFQTR